MKWCTAVFLVGLVVLCHTGESHSRRVRRRIDQFGTMISETTNRNPMDFNGYGNYCGLGGEGETVDEIDECCKVHDGCYAHLNRNECKALLKYRVYTTKYRWMMIKGEITCMNEGADESCPKAICECDKAAATCFGKHKHLYDSKNKNSAITASLSHGFKRLMG